MTASNVTVLTKYDQACMLIAEARTVDELRDIIDVCEAAKLYAKRAQNRELEINASEVRHRAERRYGELLAELRAEGKLVEGRPRKTLNPEGGFPRVTLDDLKTTYNFSSKCQRLADMSAPEFERMLAEWRKDMLANEGAFSLTAKEKADRRARRERELSARICALPTKKFGLIVADPEWRFEVWSRETGMDRAADNHYPTSLLEIIKERDVPSIAADDCALALWSTVPMLPQALQVMEAWGFTYKTNFVWAKDRIGPGYWNRNKHEILLFGTRGQVPCPAPGQQWDSLIEAPRRGHSEKPEIFLEMLENYFPNVPKIELNRRGPARREWDCWGWEAEQPNDGMADHRGRARVSSIG